MQQLGRGERPDVTVFYDGFNDCFTAYGTKQAGNTINEWNRVAEFNLLKRPGALARHFFEHTGTYWATQRLAAKLGGEKPWVPPTPAEAESLLRDTLRIYEVNIDAADGLAARYSFQPWFFWQPDLFIKTPLTSFEAGLKSSERDLRAFFEHQHEFVSRAPVQKRANFRDLSGMVQGVADNLFIDGAHMSEYGYDLVAKRMASASSRRRWPSESPLRSNPRFARPWYAIPRRNEITPAIFDRLG